MSIDIEMQKKVLSLLNKIDSERAKYPDRFLWLLLKGNVPVMILTPRDTGRVSREAMLFEQLMILFVRFGELCMIEARSTKTKLIIHLKTVD